jgi:hypothetical protein
VSRLLQALRGLLFFTLLAMSTGCTVYVVKGPPQGFSAQGQAYQAQGFQGSYAQAQGYSQQGFGRCYNGVYSCPPPGAVMYQPGYRGPAPQYGPYGYSAAMTAKITPHVYVRPSQPSGVVRARRVSRVLR